MKPSPTLPALALACVVVLGACGGGDDDLANVTDEGSSPSKSADSEGSDGMPELFELNACDTLSAEELDAAGLEPEPSNRAGEAGDSTGACGVAEELAQLLAPRFPQSG